jgi:hypothetical protein
MAELGLKLRSYDSKAIWEQERRNLQTIFSGLLREAQSGSLAGGKPAEGSGRS